MVGVCTVKDALVEGSDLGLVVKNADQLFVESGGHRVAGCVMTDNSRIIHVADPEVLGQIFCAREVGFVVEAWFSVQSLEHEAAGRLIDNVV